MVIFILMGNSRRPKRLYDLKEWRFYGGISGIEKVGKLWRGGETILAWSDISCLITLTLPVTSWELIVRAPVLQHVALMWIQTEFFYYYRLHVITCPSAPWIQSLASSLWNFLLSLDEQSEKLHDSSFLRNDIPSFQQKSGSYLKRCDIACLVGDTSRLSNQQIAIEQLKCAKS